MLDPRTSNRFAPLWTPLACGAVSAAFWLLAWVGMFSCAFLSAPLCMALAVGMIADYAHRFGDAARGRTQALRAILFAFPHAPVAAVGHLYLWQTVGPSLVLLALYLASFLGVTAWLCGWLKRRLPHVPLALIVPCVWVSLEVLRGEWLLGGYAWYLAGHAVTLLNGPAPLAPLIGAYGTSFLLVLVATLMTCSVVRRVRNAWTELLLGIGATVALTALGLLHAPSQQHTLRVSILQTNLPQSNKLAWPIAERIDTHARWLNLSKAAASQSRPPALIVWPETMFPGQALNPDAVQAQRDAGLRYPLKGPKADLPATWFADQLLVSQAETDVPWLVGALAIEGLHFTPTAQGVRTDSTARYNSLFLVNQGQVASERYDKIALMAFGEYIPFFYRWPTAQQWLVSLGAQGMAFDLGFGIRKTAFALPQPATGATPATRVVTPICFEVCHTDLCRTMVFDGSTRRADLIVNATNDGWFYGSNFNRRLHLLNAQWRCAELATPMVRAANTGISCFIDARGKVTYGDLPGPPFRMEQVERVITGDLQLPDPASGPTLYARLGYLLKYVVLALNGGLIALALFRPLGQTSSVPAA